MGTGILVCGLNGAGKSTVGKALAEALGYYFMDIEALYFPKTDQNYTYDSPRTREEVLRLLHGEIETHENFVLASVIGDFGENICRYFQYAVLIQAPGDIRITRVKNRSFQKFGDRMLPGGDLYEKEQEFFDFVESRPEDLVENWVRSLSCPVIRVDGTKPVSENIPFIVKELDG